MKLTAITISAFLSLIMASCSGCGHTNPFDTVGMGPYAEEDASTILPGSPDDDKASSATSAISSAAAPVAPRTVAGASDDPMWQALRIGRLRDVFNDSNKYHYMAAMKIGIDPIVTLADAYYSKRPMMKVESNPYYTVDSLTHSMPFLVPEASSLLDTIGVRFAALLKHKGLPPHRFRVTSLLRSHYAVKRLRRVNRNAVDSSTHQLGTTFDISWSRFEPVDSTREISDATLKQVLAEVLFDLRSKKKCLVVFERKSPCFHITATGE